MPRNAKPLLTPAQRQAAPELVEHALTLIGRMHHGQPQAARQAGEQLRKWIAQAPEHAQAAATAQQIWQMTDGGELRGRFDAPPSAHEKRQTRRRTLGALGIAGLLLAGGAGGRWYWQQPTWQMALQTGRGQTLSQPMPDGSTLDLAANTAARASLHRNRRGIWLERGAMHFAVRHDEQRPFTVETRWGKVQVLGTRFTVASNDERMRVAVAQGRVAVFAPSASGEHPQDLDANIILTGGESIEITTDGLQARQNINAADVADWTQGWLVFSNTPLPEAIARWNDYLRTPIRLGGDAAALRPLRISGRYRLDDPTAFVRALQDMAALRATQGTDGSVEIAPAK